MNQFVDLFDNEWAACRDIADPEIFFPASEYGIGPYKAKQVCLSCPVIDLCAAWALKNRPSYGIWGGMTPKEISHKARIGRWQK